MKRRYIKASTSYSVDEMWDILMEYAGVSEETLDVVTSINGYNEQSLNDICYVVSGYNTVEQFMESEVDIEASCNSSRRVGNRKSVMASAWVAPNGKKYGKQTKRFPGKYLFTRRELKDMVNSGIAEDMAGTFNPKSMNYDIIGIAWNETNGYRSGILIEDVDSGELFVGNSGDAMVAKL